MDVIKKSNGYFCKIKNLTYGGINDQNFSTPTPDEPCLDSCRIVDYNDPISEYEWTFTQILTRSAYLGMYTTSPIFLGYPAKRALYV